MKDKIGDSIKAMSAFGGRKKNTVVTFETRMRKSRTVGIIST